MQAYHVFNANAFFYFLRK